MSNKQLQHPDAEEIRALMAALLEVTADQRHSVAIQALVNLAHNIARQYPCCSQSAGLQFMELGANLAFTTPAGAPASPPADPAALH